MYDSQSTITKYLAAEVIKKCEGQGPKNTFSIAQEANWLHWSF